MRICKCLCAAIALGVIACYANNGYASEPNLSLKEKVALRMASAPGNAVIQDSAVKEIEKGKVTLRKANASGKYAQGALVQNFALNDDSQETQEQLNKAEDLLQGAQERLEELNKQINSRDPNANAIKWYTPTNLKKDNDHDGKGSKTGAGEDGGWIDCFDPICCGCGYCYCCCCSCQPVSPYVIVSNGCGCGSFETGVGCGDCGDCDSGFGHVDDCSCTLDCGEVCSPARPCLGLPVLNRVVGRVRALR